MDQGSGVYRSILTIDGDEVGRSVVDADDASCADAEPGNEDAYEFSAPQPCPLDTIGGVEFDTRSLTDGTHTFKVAIEDAAGNERVILNRTIATHNAPISTTPPTVAGEAKADGALTATLGGWDGDPTDYDYRWLRCDAAGSGCDGIAGADDATYAPTSADVEHRVAVEVTAANHSGAATARSVLSAVVADGGSKSSRAAETPGHVPNGTHATGRARLEIAFRVGRSRTATRVSSIRARRWAITGQLRDGDGEPIAAARIGIAIKVAGRRWVGHGELRSGPDGAIAYKLPVGPTRAVKLTYFPFSDSRDAVTSNVLTEQVRAPVAIRADRQRVSGARVVRLSGHVGGELLPRGGVLVTLQGYQAGFGWHTFRTVRTTRRGAFRTQYRFRLSHGRFGFRAVVPRQATFPFVTSQSTPVYVTVT